MLRNDFAAITPQKISVSPSVSPTRRTLRLIDVRANTATVKPGRGVTLLITLQPYRGQAFQRTMKLIVPADTPPGRLVIEVHGRPETAAGPLSQAALLARGLTPPASLEELLKDLAGTQRGNSLIAELLTPEAAALRQQSAERLGALPQLDLFSEELPALPTLGKGADHLAGRPLAKAEVLLDRVIQGRLRAAVTVSEP